MEKNKKKQIVSAALVPLLIFAAVVFLTASVFTLNQRLVLGALFAVVWWWATAAIDRTLAAALLLVAFVIFGQTELKSIFNFPLSPTFVLILSSFMLAQGITNVHIAEHIADLVLQRWGNSPRRLILMAFVLGIIMIFLIPHPFPRVIMLGMIYKTFLDRREVAGYPRGVLMMSVYVAGTTTPMIFLNGDFILNYSALGFAGQSATWLEWARWMAPPALAACALSLALLLFVFRSELAAVSWPAEVAAVVEKRELSAKQRTAYAIMLGAMVLWATESLHGVASAWVALGGVLLMLAAGMLKAEDLRKINWQLLVYLTAVFAIGRVFNASGISAVLGGWLESYFVTGSTLIIYLLIIAVTMLIHLLLGSCTTTMSITIPIFTALLGGLVNPVVIALITYITVTMNYILPFHHLTLILGIGEGYFTNRHLRRYGLPTTALVFAAILGLFIPWWHFIGLL